MKSEDSSSGGRDLSGRTVEKNDEVLTTGSAHTKGLFDEILGELCKRVPKDLERHEYETIKGLCSDCLSPCNSKQAFLVTVHQEASVAHKRKLADHPTWHSFQIFLRRILDPIDRFSAALDILSQAAGSTGLLIWGSIRIVIQATKDLSEIPIFINKCLEDLETALPLWDEYHEILREDPRCRIRSPAIRVCVEYLIFCILVTRGLKIKFWKEIALAATKSLEDQLRQCITTIREQRTSIDYWFGASTHRNTKKIITRLDQLVQYRGLTSMATLEEKSSTRPVLFVPGLLSQRFLGRDEELIWLERLLEPGSRDNAGKRVALWGMTGIGKTQLMLKYEQRFRETYNSASFFMVAGSPDKFIQSCQAILETLELPERDKPDSDMKLYGFRNWLNERNDWLLLIDNVSNGELPYIQTLLESTKKGHVIVTSQSFAAVDKIVANEDACREIREPTKEDATRLFLMTSGVVKDSDNETLASEIVQEAGLLPHVIDQAAWYVKKHDLNLKQYLERYRQTPSQILQWQDQHRSAPVKHFNMAFEDLRQSHEDSLVILCLFSLFEPEAIPKFTGWSRDPTGFCEHSQTGFTPRNRFSLFRSLCCLRYSGPKSNSIHGSRSSLFENKKPYEKAIDICQNSARLEDAIGELWNFNHVRKTRERGALWMHDITRQMAKELIGKAEFGEWMNSAIKILYHTFPEKDNSPEDHEIVDIYLAQASVLIAQVQSRDHNFGEYAGLLALCAQCYHNRSQYQRAIQWHGEAQQRYNNMIGARHPRTITLLHSLAWSYRSSGDHTRAEQMFRQTWHLRSIHQGPESPEALESLGDLAALIERLGRLKEAEDLFIDLHNKQISCFGTLHPITIAGAHNLALCYANQGRISEAEVLYRQALEASERTLGKDDEGTIKTVGNLAVALDHNCKLGEAELLYERALETYIRHFGYDSLLSLRVRSNISGLYRQQGLFIKAENMIQDVLTVVLDTLGKSHCHVAEAMYDAAEVLHDKGSLYHASKIYPACINMWEDEAPGHPLKFRVMDAAGILERERGELEKSRFWSERAYIDNLKLLGWLDPYTLVAANNYAELLHAEGEYSEASRLYQKCLEGFKELLGTNHPHYFMVLNNIGRLSWVTGTEPMSFFVQARQGLKGLLGETHFCALTVELNEARTHLTAGRFDAASGLMLKIKQAYTTAPEMNHPRLGVVNFFLGMLSAAKGDCASTSVAISLFKDAEENYIKSLGASHPNFLWTRCMLIRTLQKCGRDEEANTLLSNIEPHYLLNVSIGPKSFGVEELTFRDLISMESDTFNGRSFMQLPFGETIRLRWGRKAVWRPPKPTILHS